MKCGFCNREISEEPGMKESCGACPGGCRKVHCPYCGYANPLVTGRLRRWAEGKNKPSKDDER